MPDSNTDQPADMKRYLALIALALTACKSDPTAFQVPVALATQENADRFTVTQVSQFYDARAYQNYRGIFIIKDGVTGREYIGVTGIGISEVATHTETSTDGEGNVTVETVKHEQ